MGKNTGLKIDSIGGLTLTIEGWYPGNFEYKAGKKIQIDVPTGDVKDAEELVETIQRALTLLSDKENLNKIKYWIDNFDRIMNKLAGFPND